MHRVILLVEDEEINVLMFRKAMQKVAANYPVMVVQNGLEALAYFQGTGKFGDRQEFPLPDLVLLDSQLPYVRGLDVLKWIRAQPELRSIVVIMLTTCEHPENIRKAYALGANAYLVKPLTVTQFENMIRAFKEFWLDHNQTAQPFRSARCL